MQWIKSVLGWVGDVLAPLHCAACNEALTTRALLCPACASTVVRWTGDGRPMAFCHYGGALASTLLRLKYGNRPDLGPVLGQLLCPVVLSHVSAGDVDVVVPIPVPYDRLIERGYNQAALIARPLAAALSAPLGARILRRNAASVKQASLNRRDRLTNLQGAFSLRDERSVEGKRVLLVDDVTTTGATLAACQALMERAGARCVDSVVVARTESKGL